MTEDELIAAERRVVDLIMWQTPARKKRLYVKMREYSLLNRKGPLPNDVSIDDAWLQLVLRAKDLAGVSNPTGFYLPPGKRK